MSEGVHTEKAEDECTEEVCGAVHTDQLHRKGFRTKTCRKPRCGRSKQCEDEKINLLARAWRNNNINPTQ